MTRNEFCKIKKYGADTARRMYSAYCKGCGRSTPMTFEEYMAYEIPDFIAKKYI